MEAIKTSALTKRFAAKTAVANLNLRVEAGSVYGLLGPNGAGKTTTLRLLMGLIRPTAGSIEIYGKEVGAKELFPSTAYVSDQSNLYPSMTAKQIIKFASSLHPRWNDEVISTCQKLFELPVKQKIATYSHGQKKLLAITLALASQAKLIVLDEPTVGLDPQHKRDVLTLLIEYVAESDRTVLISTHQISTLDRFIDHFGILNEGSLVVSDSMIECKEKYSHIIIAWPEQNLPPTVSPRMFLLAEQNEQTWHFITDNAVLIEVLKQSQPSYFKQYALNLEDIFFLYTKKGENNA